MPRDVQSGLEEVLGHRFRRLYLMLQHVLPSDRAALGKQLAFVDNAGVVRREGVSDHSVGLEKRAQNAVRTKRPKALEHRNRRFAPARQRRTPVRLLQRELALDLGAKLALVLEEELELEQIAQTQRFVPKRRLSRVGRLVRGLEQREFGNGAVDEEVDDRVA